MTTGGLIIIVLSGLGALFLFLLFQWLKELKELLRESRERSHEVIEEKLKREEQYVESRKAEIKNMIEQIGRQLKDSQEKLESAEKERLETFSRLKVVLDQHHQATEHLQSSTDHLKDILSHNQKRGQYGEEVAEQLIQAVGFVRGENYLVHPQTDSDTRPDLTLLLPDQTKVNIDVKFPLTALVEHQEAGSEAEKTAAFKKFAGDVRQKIKEATGRSYISPEEGTADFVIVFVPNEMVFSFIYDQLRDVWQEALRKRVILAGPFSFVAILRTIHWSHQNFKYQENLRGIVRLIKTFEEEYQKFDQALDKLGDSINKAAEHYRQVSQVRQQKLNRVIDRIKGEEPDLGREN